MSFSYRLKKRELVLMLDLAGDVNSLEQKFGDIYISRDEHEKTVLKLQEKGMITVSGETVIPESRTDYVLSSFYRASLVWADEKLETWLYCTGKMITAVSQNGIFASEYIITPLVSDEDREEYFAALSERKFSFLRGGEGTVSGDGISNFITEYSYE